MEDWQSRWLTEVPGSDHSLNSSFNHNEESVNSPDVSRDSAESGEDRSEKNDVASSKSSLSTALAKRRLQAYSHQLQIKKVLSKDGKVEDDKSDKSPVKKTKKVLYPDDRAKAVIHEIEQIKRLEAQEEEKKQEQTRVLVAAAIKSLEYVGKPRSRSLSSEGGGHFKRRDIKSRNYRRTDSVSRKSPSPEDRNRKSSRKPSYPKNWTQYQEMRLTVVKDGELKGKLFKLPTIHNCETYAHLYNFQSPSLILEPFSYLSVDDVNKEIPIPFVRYTKSRPSVSFSVNFDKNKESFLNRMQLFQIISNEQRQLVEKLIESSSSKPQGSPKKTQNRQWFHKSWKKSGDAECKVLEQSVGLSFLQNYSDEEEEINDLDEQVVVCSGVKDNSEPVTNAKGSASNCDISETSKDLLKGNKENRALDVGKPQSSKSPASSEKLALSFISPIEPGEIIEDDESDKLRKKVEEKRREHTPEIVSKPRISRTESRGRKNFIKAVDQLMKKKAKTVEVTKIEKVEIGKIKDKKSEDKAEADKVKDKKCEISDEVKVAKKNKKKKKKPKKKLESPESESDEENILTSKRKKKKRKYKRKHTSSETDDSSSEEEDLKKKSKKKKQKKKSKSKKEIEIKESKSKRRDDSHEEKKHEVKKKKKKSSDKTEAEEVSDEVNLKKESRKAGKKKKLKKKKEADVSGEIENTDTSRSSKKRKRNHFKDVTEDSTEHLNDNCERVKSKVTKIKKVDPDKSVKGKPDKQKDAIVSKGDNDTHKSKKRKLSTEDGFDIISKSKHKKNKLKDEDHSGDIERKYKNLKEISRSLEEVNTLKNKNKGDKLCKLEKKKKYLELEFNEEGTKKEIAKKKFHKKKRDLLELDFPLMKDSLRPKSGDEIFTPVTEEYWEKDLFPLWESEDEGPPKVKERQNTSWESDEEIFERGHDIPDKNRSFNDSVDLEIPLNIPVKKRQLIDADTELKLLKIEGRCLNEERRQFEIEKIKVKELELKVMKEVRGKAERPRDPIDGKNKEGLDTRVEKFKNKVERPRVVAVKTKQDFDAKVVTLKNKVEHPQVSVGGTNKEDIDAKLKNKVEQPLQNKNDKAKESIDSKAEKPKSVDSKAEKPKRDRWDKKVAEPKASTPQKNIVDLTVSEVAVKRGESSKGASAVLENEYEEFMRALNSGKEKKNNNEDIASCVIDLTENDCKSDKGTPTRAKPFKRDVTADIEGVSLDVAIKPIELLQTLIPAKDVPFIPMPSEVKPFSAETKPEVDPIEIKPVPVPSPKLDIEQIPIPLINFNMSANIEKVVQEIGSPILLNLVRPVPKSEGLVSSSGIDAIFNSTPVITSSVAQEGKSEPLSDKLVENTQSTAVPMASPLTDTSLDSTLFEDKPAEPTYKPFSFSGMVLPTKKVLLSTTGLKLDDSDEEGTASRFRLKLEEMKEFSKEILTETPFVAAEKEEPPKTTGEVVAEQDNKPATDGSKICEQNYKESSSQAKEKRQDRSRSPPPARIGSFKASGRREESPRRASKRVTSPRRRRNESPRRRGSPLRRRGSPRRRSPDRRRTPDRRRSPDRRRLSPAKRKLSLRRSRSPGYNRRSPSPRRRSPRRSISPRPAASKRHRSRSPVRIRSVAPYKSPERSVIENNAAVSPVPVASPLERLKRSVADSTISDDLLPQPEEYNASPVPQFYDRMAKRIESPMRVPLDIRINQELGYMKNEPKQHIENTYDYPYNIQQNQYSQFNVSAPSTNSYVSSSVKNKEAYSNKIVPQASFVQVGNMVQIVPTEMHIKTENLVTKREPTLLNEREILPEVTHQEKSKIVQVGNMLQIVPTDFSSEISPQPQVPEPKKELEEPVQYAPVPAAEKTETRPSEMKSAEEVMQLKTAERREEREQRRLEKEKKRKEKDKRRKEKEKERQIKLKQKTENMIKRALQLEVEGLSEGGEIAGAKETPTQWPPVPHISGVSKDLSKSILRGSQGRQSNVERKIVHFADGIKPGEGTSPSGGEELTSPPPRKILPKEKRYKKTKLLSKIQKKKVKVKVIKKASTEPTESDEEADNLPPPSPPPGSPPPHIFPPRVKPAPINNIHPLLTSILGIQQPSAQQQQQTLYRPSGLNLIMAPPPLPHHHGPPGPPPHHGPPHHGGPPHHHGGPPPPHHHGGPPQPHHLGPPPPPPHHHHPPPPGPPHHHHHHF